MEKDEGQVDDSDEDTDVEYYAESYAGSIKKGPVMTSMMSMMKPKQEKSNTTDNKYTCAVCREEFRKLQEFLQHLGTAECESGKCDIFQCDICQAYFNSAGEYKNHRIGHIEGGNFSCVACGTDFNSKRALDRHMFVDANILNLLFKNDKAITLPDLLCGTVVDILARSANVTTGVSSVRDNEDDEFENEVKEEETDEYESENYKELKRQSESFDDESTINNFDNNANIEESEITNDGYDDDNSENPGDPEEERVLDEESQQPSETEQDWKDAEKDLQEYREDDLENSSDVLDEGDEDDDGTITRPFHFSSLTDLPMTPGNFNYDDSSRSAENSVDTVSSNSRRKHTRPKQVQRNASRSKKRKAEQEASEDTQMSASGDHSDTEALKCPMCDEKVPDDQNLRSHLQEHEKLFPYFCTLCDANFMKGYLLKTHVLTSHAVGESQNCDVCGMTFKLRSSLLKHKKICKQPPECVVCNRTFNCGQDLEKHFYSHSIDERAKVDYRVCHECEEVFTTTQKLRIHQKTHITKQLFSCEICGAVFLQHRVMERHKQAHFRDQDCRCHICGAQLLTLSGLLAHLRGHRNVQSRQGTVKVETPEKINIKTENVKKENSTVKIKQEPLDSDENSQQQEEENIMMSSKKYLQLIDSQFDENNVKTEESSDLPPRERLRPHRCPFCALGFYKIDRFQAHIRKDHLDEAQFEECDVCQAKIFGTEYMRQHQRSHGNVQQTYACDQCSKVFVRKFSLETHRKVHTFQKFLKCEICNEGFRFNSELSRHHRKAHPVDRSNCTFECNICWSKFSTLANLETHCSTSHVSDDGKPFMCALCPSKTPSTFKNSTELKKHLHFSHTRAKSDKSDDASNSSLGDREVNIKQEPMDESFERVNKDDPLYGQVQDMIRNFVSSLPCKGNSDITIQPKVEDPVTEVEAYNKATKRLSQSLMERKFQCETCHKCFATKSDLRTHIRTHTGETPYKCEYCSRAFKQRGHRKLHIQVAHTLEMPYTCELCGQSYPTRYRYQVHIKRHSGIKEHQCPFCPNKAYYTVGKLNEHKRKHHLEEFMQEQAEKDSA